MTSQVDFIPNEILCRCFHYVTNIVDIYRISRVDVRFRNLIGFLTRGTTYPLLMKLIQRYNFRRVVPSFNHCDTNFIVVHHSIYDYQLIIQSKEFCKIYNMTFMKCFLISDGTLLIQSFYSGNFELNEHLIFDGHSIISQTKLPIFSFINNECVHFALSINCKIWFTSLNYGYELQLFDINRTIMIESDFILRLTKYYITDSGIIFGILLRGLTKSKKPMYHYTILLTNDNQLKYRFDYCFHVDISTLDVHTFGDANDDFVCFLKSQIHGGHFSFYQKNKNTVPQISFLFQKYDLPECDSKILIKKIHPK